MVEVWKEVEGFPGYEVSTFGRVRSWHPRPWNAPALTEPLLKSPKTCDKYGHLETPLYAGGGQVFFKVHRLVAIAFLPNPENKPQVAHINGVAWDNRVENLRWSTALENSADAVRHGTVAKGEQHAGSKLSDNDIREIRASSSSVHSVLGLKYGVSRSQISRIKRGVRSGNLPKPR